MFAKDKDASRLQTQEALESQFSECYAMNHRSLRRYLARLSGETDTADDLVQEVFARLWKELEQRRKIESPRAWLFRVGSNLVISRVRTQARGRRHEHETKISPLMRDVERSLMRKQIVERALRQLPEPMRQCLLLYHEGLTGKEIAAVLGVKASYVGTLVLRAHERFRRECEAAGGSRELLG